MIRQYINLRLIVSVFFIFANTIIAQQIDVVKIKTPVKNNRIVDFRYRVPEGYDKASVVKYRVLVYFGGRNTRGEWEINSPSWSKWCDNNKTFLVVPTYQDDNYWEPQKWSGKALVEAISEIKKKYPNICDNKLLFYGFSGGGQCSNLFPDWIPNRTRAYVSHASGVFHKPNTRMKGIAGLLTCGDADRRRLVINHRFIEEYRKLGANILWKSFPNHPHDVPEGSIYLAQAFMEYYHKLYECDLDSSKKPPKENKDILYIGDDQDGIIYPVNDPASKQIYPEDKVFFTSKELADAWVHSATLP